MRISTFYKWTMLLLAAWFYGGEAKAQFRAVVDEPGGKQALYGDNQPGWNSLRVDVRNMGLGTVSYYECAVGPAGYVPAEADYDRNNCGVQQGTGTARTLSDIPDIHHGINVVWFRAVATVLSISLQPPFFVTREEHSQPENMSWFVDAQADVPTPQNVDANGEVIVTPNTPGGTCDPVIVPMVVENGAWLSYRVDNGPLEGHMTPVPVPASPPYLSDYDLVLTGHSLNEGESLELYVWIAYDGFGHNGVEPATPWIVRCQPPPPVLSISVDSPIEGETYDTLEEATGTASADITEVVLCLDGQTGADCTSCPTLNEAFTCHLAPLGLADGDHTLVATGYDSGGQASNTVTVNFIIEHVVLPLVLSISVDNPIEGETYDTLEEATGTASADITEVVLCLDGQTGADCTSCPTLNEAFACHLAPLGLADGDHTLVATGYDSGGQASNTVTVNFIIETVVLPSVLSIAVNSPVEGRTYAMLDAATGTASADITEVILCWDGQSGADCTLCALNQEAFTCDLASLGNGSYSIVVTGYDNRGQASNSVTVNFTINASLIEGNTGTLTRRPYKIAGGSDISCSSTSGAPLAMLALAFFALARRRKA